MPLSLSLICDQIFLLLIMHYFCICCTYVPWICHKTTIGNSLLSYVLKERCTIALSIRRSHIQPWPCQRDAMWCCAHVVLHCCQAWTRVCYSCLLPSLFLSQSLHLMWYGCVWGEADVVKSGIGCVLFSVVLLAWALTFAFGGERLFGSYWKHLAIFDIDDKYGPA
jgi:hypothetical protein